MSIRSAEAGMEKARGSSTLCQRQFLWLQRNECSCDFRGSPTRYADRQYCGTTSALTYPVSEDRKRATEAGGRLSGVSQSRAVGSVSGYCLYGESGTESFY